MKPSCSRQFLQFVGVLSTSAVFFMLPQKAGAQTCSTATIWTSPPVVHYRTVIRDSEKHRLEPNFTVFIELPDGSAANIDPGSIKLNGLAALGEPRVIGDANENGVADLMVKSNRSVLVTGDGLLTVTGSTTSGACFAGQTNVQLHCAPTTVERSDYFLEFTTSDMPDVQLNGLPARLDVHRVRPVFPAACPNITPIRALVLVHGRTVPATAVFDLPYQDYSLMERLAMRGIDTFAANHLGFGLSAIQGNNPLDEPCNASLPQCAVPIGGTCSPLSGVCDCEGLPARMQRMDQQGSTSYLNPNPRIDRCKHTSNTRFERVTNQVSELDLVIDDALAKTGLAKVHLLGLSNGGHTVGKYLGDSLPHRDKVAGVVFLASTGFGGIAGLDEQPPRSQPTWPLGLINGADAMSGFNLVLTCPGQQGAGIADALWNAIRARDPIGSTWGPQPHGLSRYPIVSRFLWNPTVASNIDTPALVLNGLNDNVVLPTRSVEIWSSSPRQVPETTCTSDAECAPEYACRPFPAPARCRLNNRILQQLDCASHALLWETCSGENCIDPHKTVQKRIGDWILTGK